ncbi:SDR family oxidoreductase [Haloferula sp. BvORR071]|uniref:SDR family NAD(P)-dependent oxidoreductase n=1 Tax=Haloferula sp. BvORR071 TaxID=1396141 RepID=UPI00055751FB|nr:SDR family oxidoreductase [Haloferula sp. BvORR071]
MSQRAAKEILVTGASSGIGLELARQLAAPGVRLWLVARSGDKLEELAAELRTKGAEAEVVVQDLADIDRSGVFLDWFLKENQLDEVYLAAAVSIFGEVKDIQPEDWDQIYRTDLLSYAQWVQACYSQMVARKSGRLVMVSSLAGYAGYPTSVPYATMKAGLLGLYRTLRYEAPMHGVKVHLVSPGYVRTRIYETAIYRRSNYDNTMKQIGEMGFPMIEAAPAATAILKGCAAGKGQIVFPFYAKLLAWAGPRFPWLVRSIHAKMVKRFRELSA